MPPQNSPDNQRRTVFTLLGIALVFVCMSVFAYVVFLKPELDKAKQDASPAVNTANVNRATNADGSAAVNSGSNRNGNIATNTSANANQAVNSTSGVQPSLVNAQAYLDKSCTAEADCGVFPCVNGECLVQECTCSCKCVNSTCGGSTSAAPGYCITNQGI